MADRNQWGSNLSFILAMIGSAVGLGNIWRYPYVLYANGGGAFYIPYIIAILLMGVPFLILEYGIGYNFKSSFPKALKQFGFKWEYFGWFLPIANFILMIYYSAILGWDGIYVFLSFFKGWGVDPNNFFTQTLLQSSASLSGAFQFIPLIAVVMLAGWLIIWLISHGDLEEGLGRVSKILVPTLFLIMAVIVIFSLLLPGASEGLAVLFNPDWSLLGNFKIWSAAFGQILFSLSLGFSLAFTYASYTRDDSDLITNTLSIVLANTLFENFAALGVFSILGYMSLQSGIPVSEIVTQGTGLVFVVFPEVFNVLGQWAFFLGPVFFFTIYLAGLTSILSMIEPISFSIQNKFGLSRKRTMTILIVVGAAFSMIFATSFSEMLIQYTDTFINQIAVLLGIVFECILFAWMFDAEKLMGFLNARSKTIKLGKGWLLIVRFVLPIVVAIIWLGGLGDIITNGTADQLMVTIILAVILLVSCLVFTVLPARNPDWDNIEERIKS